MSGRERLHHPRLRSPCFRGVCVSAVQRTPPLRDSGRCPVRPDARVSISSHGADERSSMCRPVEVLSDLGVIYDVPGSYPPGMASPRTVLVGGRGAGSLGKQSLQSCARPWVPSIERARASGVLSSGGSVSSGPCSAGETIVAADRAMSRPLGPYLESAVDGAAHGVSRSSESAISVTAADAGRYDGLGHQRGQRIPWLALAATLDITAWLQGVPQGFSRFFTGGPLGLLLRILALPLEEIEVLRVACLRRPRCPLTLWLQILFDAMCEAGVAEHGLYLCKVCTENPGKCEWREGGGEGAGQRGCVRGSPNRIQMQGGARRT